MASSTRSGKQSLGLDAAPWGSAVDTSTFHSTRLLLQTSSMSSTTVKSYSSAVTRFLHYCHSQPKHPHHTFPHPSSMPDLDNCLQNYITFTYLQHNSTNKQLAINAVYGIYLIKPEWRGSLKRSEQLLKGWDRLVPSVSHPPLTWPLVVLIASTFAANQQLDCAIATLVAFDSMLRISEMVNITVGDISSPGDLRRTITNFPTQPHSSSVIGPSSSRVCIRLAHTKTGSNQWTEIFNEDIGSLLSRFIEHRPLNELAFTFPSTRPADWYRRAMHVALDGLKLGSHGFTPHSLRHGGATHAHLHLHQSIEQIMHRGRWQSNKACRSYIQSGNAALITQQLSTATSSLALSLSASWYPIMAAMFFPS